MLEASLRGRKDFQSAIDEFFGWLKGMEGKLSQLDSDTSNPQSVKDTNNRKRWLYTSKVHGFQPQEVCFRYIKAMSFYFYFKDLKAEVSAHSEVLLSLRETGKKLLETVESPVHQKDVGTRLAEINRCWEDLQKRSEEVQLRLETAQEQWERLTTLLREEIYWAETADKNLSDQQPLGSDLELLRKQKAFVLVVSNRQSASLYELAKVFVSI